MMKHIDQYLKLSWSRVVSYRVCIEMIQLWFISYMTSLSLKQKTIQINPSVVGEKFPVFPEIILNYIWERESVCVWCLSNKLTKSCASSQNNKITKKKIVTINRYLSTINASQIQKIIISSKNLIRILNFLLNFITVLRW